MAEESPVRIGDRYEVLCTEQYRLGSGGQGQVFRGRDIKNHQDVAVKTLDIRDNVTQRYAQQELDILRSVWHDNVIKLYDVRIEHTVTYLVMELCSHGDLNNFARSRLIDDEMLVSLAEDVATGIHYLHGRQIVHRDLKPLNILIQRTDSGYCAKVGDVGYARFFPAYSAAVTATRNIGTRGWHAPEVWSEDDSPVRYNKEVDIFSFALILCSLITQRPGEDLRPITVDGISIGLLIRARRRTDDPVELPAIHIPDDDAMRRRMKDLILLMICPDPQQRPHIADVKTTITSIRADVRTAASVPASGDSAASLGVEREFADVRTAASASVSGDSASSMGVEREFASISLHEDQHGPPTSAPHTMSSIEAEQALSRPTQAEDQDTSGKEYHLQQGRDIATAFPPETRRKLTSLVETTDRETRPQPDSVVISLHSHQPGGEQDDLHEFKCQVLKRFGEKVVWGMVIEAFAERQLPIPEGARLGCIEIILGAMTCREALALITAVHNGQLKQRLTQILLKDDVDKYYLEVEVAEDEMLLMAIRNTDVKDKEAQMKATSKEMLPLPSASKQSPKESTAKLLPTDPEAKLLPTDPEAKLFPTDPEAKLFPTDPEAKPSPTDPEAKLFPTDPEATLFLTDIAVKPFSTDPEATLFPTAGMGAPRYPSSQLNWETAARTGPGSDRKVMHKWVRTVPFNSLGDAATSKDDFVHVHCLDERSYRLVGMRHITGYHAARSHSAECHAAPSTSAEYHAARSHSAEYHVALSDSALFVQPGCDKTTHQYSKDTLRKSRQFTYPGELLTVLEPETLVYYEETSEDRAIIRLYQDGDSISLVSPAGRAWRGWPVVHMSVCRTTRCIVVMSGNGLDVFSLTGKHLVGTEIGASFGDSVDISSCGPREVVVALQHPPELRVFRLLPEPREVRIIPLTELGLGERDGLRGVKYSKHGLLHLAVKTYSGDHDYKSSLRVYDIKSSKPLASLEAAST